MAEHEQEGKSEGGGGKLSTKKLIIIIAAGVLLLAAGGGGMFFVMKGQVAAPPEAESHKKHINDSLYYEMSKPFVVDFPTGSSMGLVQIATTFVVEDQETADALRKNEPMLRNNLMLIVSAQTPDDLNTTEGKEKLRKAMLDEVNGILKKLNIHGEVTEVLFTSFIMQ
ncbi:MAG: flagellar basal body-associated FliL family protein [Methylovulum sp.]|nr:flagellar basal body-associated FliL family protein [Methylovulum sp.]